MSPAETDCYRHHLEQAQCVLEYGVGGSTVLAAQSNLQSLYCVETDPAWLDQVRADPAVAAMVAAGRARLVHLDLGTTRRWGKPSRSAWYRWPRYARQPWRDGYQPDLVMVDGRFRVSCIMHALLHGTDATKIVVHDFWRRARYHAVLRFAAVVDQADDLVVLRRNDAARWRAQLVALRYRYDRR